MKYKLLFMMHYTVATALVLSLSIGCVQGDKTNCKIKLKDMRWLIDATIRDYGDYEVMLSPCTYCPGDFIRYIFATPKDNTVGTNELDNAITLLEFINDKELEHKVVKKNFMEMVTGPFEFRFLPVWSEKEIAYSQSQGFLLVNIPDKDVEIHTISHGMYSGGIENVAVFDGDKRIFVLEVLKSRGNGVANIWDDKTLKVIRFENNKFKVLAERPAGKKTGVYTEPWFVYQKLIFIYNDSTTKLEVYDELFNPVIHPMAEVFNNNHANFRCMAEIVVHPTLPFALIVEQGKWPSKDKLMAADSLPTKERRKTREIIYDEAERLSLYLLRWNHPDPKQQLVPLISATGSIWNSYNPANKYSHFTFSPDGKWVVFQDKTMRGKNLRSIDNPIFIAVPVNEKNPMYLGKPIKLGNALRDDAIGPKSTAWTTKPTAFVMCDGMVLYRWNLDKYRSMKKVKVPPTEPDPFKRR